MVKAERKISVTFYLTKTQLEKLRELRTRTKIPVAEHIRAGIDLALKGRRARRGYRH